MENQQPGKPRSVAVAMYLLWASLAISLVSFAANYSNLTAAPNLPHPLVVLAIEFVVYVFLVLMMYSGRNWARITFLLLFLIEIVLPVLWGVSTGKLPGIDAMSLAKAALQASALILVFTSPGKTWFQKARAPEQGSLS